MDSSASLSASSSSSETILASTAVATECSSSEADADELPAEATDVEAFFRLCSALFELWLVSMAEEFNLEGNSLEESSKLVSEALRHELGDSDRVEIADEKRKKRFTNF